MAHSVVQLLPPPGLPPSATVPGRGSAPPFRPHHLPSVSENASPPGTALVLGAGLTSRSSVLTVRPRCRPCQGPPAVRTVAGPPLPGWTTSCLSTRPSEDTGVAPLFAAGNEAAGTCA